MKVLLAIPTGKWIHHKLVPKIVEICADKRHEVTLFVSEAVDIGYNLNCIVKHFRKGDWDYLLLIETDQVPNCNPLDLIKHNKDIVSVPTILLVGDKMMWNAFDKNEDKDWKEFPLRTRKERGFGLERIYATSVGCILIKREVLESIPMPFTTRRNAYDRRMYTQDVEFFLKCEEWGFETWIDWEKTCSHYKEIDILKI